MRLADIFKKIQQESLEKSHEEKVIEDKTQQTKTPTPSIVEIERKKEQEVLLIEKIYADAISYTRTLFSSLAHKKNNISLENIFEVIKGITTTIQQYPDKLLLYCTYSTPDSYIYAHSVNVAILTSLIGQIKKFPQEELFQLTLCGLLHDIGMLRVLDIVNKPQKLSYEEYEKIKKHPLWTKEELVYLSLPTELRNLLSEIIPQAHERLDGSGYPSGLTSQEIHPWAKIISIADIYEAMSHPRPYRDRFLAHTAVVELIRMAQGLVDSEITKLFVDRISLFPVGSYVKLSSGDIAKVIQTNIGFPVRPKVKVILTAEKTVPVTNTEINLAKESKIYVLEPLDETKLVVPDKRLLLQLKAQRWWVK